MDKPSPITKLLQKTPRSTQDLLKHGRDLNRLNRILHTHLDKDFTLHCQLGNVRDGVLIIYVDSSAWASRLRYETPRLLKELSQEKHFSTVREIEIRVRPLSENNRKIRKIGLSSEAAKCVESCAEGMPDGKLKESLLRLAAHKAPSKD